MASSGHFEPSQTYDGYRAVEVLDHSCSECLAKGKDCFQHYNPRSSKCHYCLIGKRLCRCTGALSSNVRRYLWSRKDGPFGKEFPVSDAPTPDGTSEFLDRDVARLTNVGGPIPVGGRPIYSSSEVPISSINTEGVVKRIRRISDSPTDPDASGSDELDGEEVQVVPDLVGHPSSNSSSQPLANRFQSQVIPSTPRTFQPALASIRPSSPSTSHSRPALNPAVRPSASQQPRNSPITTSCQLQPVSSSRRRRDGLSPVTLWNVVYNLPVFISISTGLIAFLARVTFSEPFWQEFPFLRSGRQHCDNAIGQVPEEEIHAEDSDSDSMGHSIRESLDNDQDPIEETQ
ncbi:hypothetical protein O181_069722 [Austropuccinia psidii MF-1]|uniref:Uncharacterized protein n=1 Tax=Austropuccinia psidii MF-1 TaxID=1389203 RepID=A0A9Q3I7K2_9BASI|nr:hypothetical protein [Austropuccinia psidii MF-1]